MKLIIIEKRRLLFAILLFTISPVLINGQLKDVPLRDTNSIRIINQAIFNCEIQLPENYSVKENYPMLIALHGGGGSYESFSEIWAHFENPHFILATPEAPYRWLLNDRIGYDWSAWPSGDTSYMKEAVVLTSKYMNTIIHRLVSKYKVENVYLLGFSQGSIIAQIAGIHNHDLLKGIIILSGPELYHPDKSEIVWPAEQSTLNAKLLRIFIAHGKDDAVVNPELARKSFKQYTRYGFDVTLFEFEGGHEISKTEMREVQNWIH